MSIRSLPLRVVAAAALAAWASAPGAARQPPVPKPPIPPPPGLGAGPVTAFPDIKPPGGVTFDPAKPPDAARAAAEMELLLKPLTARLARPLPADAPPLRKVRLAQLYEGTCYLYRAGEHVRRAVFPPWELHEYVAAISTVFRVAAELEEAPAGRVALAEGRVALLKTVEAGAEARVRAGIDPPRTLNDVRSHRLEAEADLLKLKAK